MNNKEIFFNKIWQQNNRPVQLKNEINQWYFQQLRPLSSEYSSSIESCFLFESTHLNFLNKSDAWIARDGATPLLWFFYRHPQPPPLTSKIYIEASLEKYVPKKWGKHMGTYQLFSTQKKKPSQIILTGISSEEFLPKQQLPHFYDLIKIWSKRMNFKRLPKYSLISYRPLNYNRDSEYFLEYFQKLYDFFGSQIESLNLSHLNAVEDYSDTLIIDINCSHLLSDNALVHFFLNRGASLLKLNPLKKFSKKVFISEYHGFYLNDHIQPNESFTHSLYRDIDTLEKYIQSHQSIGKSKILKNQMPWLKIFNDWVQIISQ